MYETVIARSGRKWDYLYMNSLGLEIEDITNYIDFFNEEKPEGFMRSDIIDELLKCNLDTLDFGDSNTDTVRNIKMLRNSKKNNYKLFR